LGRKRKKISYEERVCITILAPQRLILAIDKEGNALLADAGKKKKKSVPEEKGRAFASREEKTACRGKERTGKCRVRRYDSRRGKKERGPACLFREREQERKR